MLKALEKRLEKVERRVEGRMDKGIEDQKRVEQHDALRQLMSTPEGRRLVRKLAVESAERIRLAMFARERAQLEAMSSPEQLERLRKQWAEEDARWEALRKRNAELDAQRGDELSPCQCRDCAGGQSSERTDREALN
jgi:hypothetical protein